MRHRLFSPRGFDVSDRATKSLEVRTALLPLPLTIIFIQVDAVGNLVEHDAVKNRSDRPVWGSAVLVDGRA